jgi:hypothetical protein
MGGVLDAIETRKAAEGFVDSFTRLQKDNPEAAQLTQSTLCEPRRTPR